MISKPTSKFRFPTLKTGNKGRYEKDNAYLSGNSGTNDLVNYEKLAQEMYEIMLADPRWDIKKDVILHRDDYKCVICGHRSGLQVHLRQYHYNDHTKQFKQPWEYADNLLISVCEPCHTEGHKKFEVPIIHINTK